DLGPCTEICNMLDDDCDGKVDEGLTGCTCVVQGAEQCDGEDDDCDGTTDEDTDIPCGTGVCLGVRHCNFVAGCNPSTSCSGEITPSTEICNGLDDDCDGRIDETPPVTCTTNAQCTGSPMTPTCDNPTGMAGMGTCVPADCSTNCGVGQLLCQNGVQVCN